MSTRAGEARRGPDSSFPQIPNADNMTTAGIISAIVAAVIALVGAVLGGLAGMHFHRKVDKANLVDNHTDGR